MRWWALQLCDGCGGRAVPSKSDVYSDWRHHVPEVMAYLRVPDRVLDVMCFHSLTEGLIDARHCACTRNEAAIKHHELLVF